MTVRILFSFLSLGMVALGGCGAEVDRPATPVGQAAEASPARSATFTAEQAAPFVQLALDCAVQEYPNKIAHTMQSDADQGTPRSLHPAFYGCFDWHSSVHGHWLLTRFARLYPEHELAGFSHRVLQAHLTPQSIAAEAGYLLAEERGSWERPYGLAWLLQLAAELREWEADGDADAAAWARNLRPLEEACVQRLTSWLPKLAYPIRTGEHSQTAFAFGLILDYARSVGDTGLEQLVVQTSRSLYLDDAGSQLRFEPSGQDFLSPILAEADLMRRVLPPAEFARWLERFLPEIPQVDLATGPPGGPSALAGWLPVAVVTDRSDGKLAHLDGLNLSRAWMLEGICSGLPAGDARLRALRAAAAAHRRDGLAAVTGEHYAGGHWLGTYALYLGSGRGLPAGGQEVALLVGGTWAQGPVAVTHGGVGSPPEWSPDCRRASDAALNETVASGSALAGALAGTVVMEDIPVFNAGTGANIRLDGRTIQMDAALMTSDGRFAAVAVIENVKNPILVARKVLDTPHRMLAGDGATRFAHAMGFADVVPTCPEAEAEYRARLERLLEGKAGGGYDTFDWWQAWNYEGPPPATVPESVKRARKKAGPETGDTVGTVTRAADGTFAVTLSTGGTSLTLDGRVGDVPIYGCGSYAGPAGAVACTGHGEEIIKQMMARTVYQYMEQGYSAKEAVRRGVASFSKDWSLGVIAVGRDGWGVGANMQMAYGVSR
jgi:isoaspartyl peptidase/L-asparaginase-like protein (Ntn-hydrolase superfamily)